jgi:carbonic anhydrase/acetyltransferase-like protein (isoleucine patch superfamily)
MACYEVGGNRPRVHPSAYVHPLASLIGRVEVGPDCYIGPFASLRGDFGAIRVGAGANVQDCCTVHGAPGGEVVLEDDAHLGHGCIIHNALVGRNVLVGMNAVVLDGVVLGEGCVVGSCCVVPSGLATSGPIWRPSNASVRAGINIWPGVRGSRSWRCPSRSAVRGNQADPGSRGSMRNSTPSPRSLAGVAGPGSVEAVSTGISTRMNPAARATRRGGTTRERGRRDE